MKVQSDLVPKLKYILKDQRVGVFIDAANLYYAASKKKIHISFDSIINWFNDYSSSANLKFYTAFDPNDEKQEKFIQEVENLGYEVIKKPIKVFANSKKGNMDIELAVDAVSQKNKFDVFVLISGDGDFSYLLQNLHKTGKKTVIIGVGGHTSYELHKESQNYFFIDRIGSVWRAKKDKNYKVFIDDLKDIYPQSIIGDSFEENDFTAPAKDTKNQNSNKVKTSSPKKKDSPIKKFLKPIIRIKG